MNQSNIKSATLIDNIYTNSTDWINGLRGILHSDEMIGNDHKSIFAILPTFSALKSPQIRTQRDFSIRNIFLKKAYSRKDWLPLYNLNSVGKNVLIF